VTTTAEECGRNQSAQTNKVIGTQISISKCRSRKQTEQQNRTDIWLGKCREKQKNFGISKSERETGREKKRNTKKSTHLGLFYPSNSNERKNSVKVDLKSEHMCLQDLQMESDLFGSACDRVGYKVAKKVEYFNVDKEDCKCIST
jgi:hypothetical protein